jgi:hypothetical protein
LSFWAQFYSEITPLNPGGVKNDFGKKIVAKVQKKKVITWSLYGIVEKDLDLK